MKPTIVITRPRAQSVPLANLVTDAGFDAVLLPTSRIENLRADDQLRETVHRISGGQYDWIVFTSANAVSSLAQLLLVAGGEGMPKSVRFAAQGAATSAVVSREFGREADFVPSRAISESFARELSSVAKGAAVLVPRSTLSTSLFVEELKRYGARVDAVSLYATVPGEPAPESLAELEGIGAARLIFTFHSPSAFEHLFVVVPGVERLLRSARIAAIGAVTAEAIQRAGYRAEIVPTEQSDAALVRAIVAAPAPHS